MYKYKIVFESGEIVKGEILTLKELTKKYDLSSLKNINAKVYATEA